MTTNPSISLCMVVCDEEACLPGFLAACRGLWDELLVVDAGSCDNTAKIMADAGARVLPYTWRDNFADARNLSIRDATGDWVLYLDADELPDADCIAALRQISQDASFGGALVNIENVFEHGWRTSTPILRMFRRDPSISFRHPIHEEVVESVMALMVRDGRELATARGQVAHSGYTPGRLTVRNKKAMGERILLSALKDDPQDLYNWFKLMEGAQFFRDDALFARHADAAMQALQAADEERLARAHFGGELLTLLSVRHYANRLPEELDLLKRWDGRLPPSAAYLLRRGQVREELGDFSGAFDDYRGCVDLYDQTANLQLAGVRPLMGMVRLSIAQGDLTRAMGYVDLALGQAPRESRGGAGAGHPGGTHGRPVRAKAGGRGLHRELRRLSGATAGAGASTGGAGWRRRRRRRDNSARSRRGRQSSGLGGPSSRRGARGRRGSGDASRSPHRPGPPHAEPRYNGTRCCSRRLRPPARWCRATRCCAPISPA